MVHQRQGLSSACLGDICYCDLKHASQMSPCFVYSALLLTRALWSKVVHDIGHRMPFGTQALSQTSGSGRKLQKSDYLPVLDMVIKTSKLTSVIMFS